MGSYDNIVKTEEIRKKVEEGDFESAQSILDTINLKKIKSLSDLNLFAEVYSKNEKYDEAADLYLKVYEKLKTRKALAQMVNISIKRGKVEDAQAYLSQYQKTANDDFEGYLFQYKIEKLKGATYEEMIQTLETLKKIDYTEKWAYELAKLYYKAEKEEECIRECSDIILWFGEGAYVEKARLLRSYYSGETDKDKLIEEMKRRANGTWETPSVNDFEDEICMETELIDDSDTEALEDNLKKDIRNILIDEEQKLSLEKINRNETDQKMQGETKKILIEESEREEYEENIEDDDHKLFDLAERLNLDMTEIFGNFLHITSVKSQIRKGLETILQEDGDPLFMIITGQEGSGKTTLAKDVALFLSKTGRLNSSKVAKIAAHKLNTVNLDEKVDTLKSCCLVIEDASKLKRVTIEKILDLSNILKGDIAVIFEENKNGMNQLFEECPQLMNLLKIQFHLPQYEQEDLVGFAYFCFGQKGYKLNDEAKKEMFDQIDRISKQSEPRTYLEKINNLVQSAMNTTDLRIGKQLTNLATEGNEVDPFLIFPEDIRN